MNGTLLVAHPGSELYGSDRMLLESVDGLLHGGHRVVVALPEWGPLAELLQEHGAEVRICTMPVARKSALRPRGTWKLLVDAGRGWCEARGLVRDVQPRSILVNTITIPLWLVIAKRWRIPSVVHVHEAERSAPALLRALLAAPLLLATRVVANSRYSVRVLTESFARFEATPVIDNGVPGPDSIRPARVRLDGGPHVIYVGRLSPRKGVDVAVEAIAALRDGGLNARLTIVGSVFPGYEWFETALRERIRSRAVSDRVRLLGFRQQVWEDLGDADIVVVPSREDEPFGNTAVEAILAARPVLVSATSGLLEATRGYAAAGTVPPGDPDALADAIASVAARWPEVRRSAIDDAALARERHSPALYRQRIRELVDELTVPGRGRETGAARRIRWNPRREKALGDVHN